jgi:hypothetical protein
MKRIYTLFFFIAALNANVFALTGGPDAYGYIWRDNAEPNGPVYSWIDIVGLPGAINVLGLGDDNTSGPYPMGFNFHYYWYDVNQFWVGANGFIMFQNGNIQHPFPFIPDPNGYDDFIAAMGSDLNFGGPGNTASCWIWTNPSATQTVISWIAVPFWQSAQPTYNGSNSFQIILDNTDSSITFQYYIQQGIYSGGGNYMTIGIENNTGNVGLQVVYNPTNLGGYYINTPYAVKYYYPPSTTYVVNDVEAYWSNNITSGGVFLSAGTPTPFQMTAAVKNTGNVAVSPFGVNCQIRNSFNTLMTQDNFTTSALTPSQIQSFTMNNTFMPPSNAPGTYRMITTTSLAGDIVASNNTAIHEIVVVDTTLANIRLSFDDNGSDGAGLSWGGGDGGAGMHFVPPFYPCRVKQLHFFIAANDSSYGFYAKVNASGGPNGLPGALLDSVYVPPTSVATSAWNDITLNVPLQIDSGSFFVSWHMGGNNITLGRDTAKPISNRTYEVLGSTWAIYRYRETEDLMINATIDRDPNVSVSPVSPVSIGAGEFYPNPASKNTLLELNANTQDEVFVTLYSVDGKIVYENKTNAGHSSRLLIPIDVNHLENGVYMCRIRAGEFETTKKITVAH